MHTHVGLPANFCKFNFLCFTEESFSTQHILIMCFVIFSGVLLGIALEQKWRWPPSYQMGLGAGTNNVSTYFYCLWSFVYTTECFCANLEGHIGLRGSTRQEVNSYRIVYAGTVTRNYRLLMSNPVFIIWLMIFRTSIYNNIYYFLYI